VPSFSPCRPSASATSTWPIGAGDYRWWGICRESWRRAREREQSRVDANSPKSYGLVPFSLLSVAYPLLLFYAAWVSTYSNHAALVAMFMLAMGALATWVLGVLAIAGHLSGAIATW
jgi:hypothetical protein